MGKLSEDMAQDLDISRADQDAFAASSYQKAEAAQKAGLFDPEIAPLTVKYIDPKTDEEKTVTISQDDGIRPGMTAEALAKIRPAFSKTGSIHAGNASQISDGAAAVLLMRRDTAQRLGQTIIGKFVNASVVGVAPLLMGQGPALGTFPTPIFLPKSTYIPTRNRIWTNVMIEKAIPPALEKAGLTVPDIDIFEINEAFASQCLWSVRHLGIDLAKVNPKGGAIAFGHPLGCSGARQIR